MVLTTTLKRRDIMDIKQLRYFIEVADTRNLSRAAENLCISQPTLSLSMKKIETELNTKVFETKVKYGLTPAGQILYDRGSEIVRSFDRLIAEVENYGQNESGTVRLGVTILFTVQFMSEISKFIANHQHINLHILQHGSINLQKKLAKGDVDVALVSLPNLYPDDIEVEHLSNHNNGYNIAAVMPKSNPLSQKESVTLTDLQDEKFSTLSEDYMIGDLLISRSRDLGFKPNIVMKHEDLHVLLHSIQELDSVCLMPIEYRNVADKDDLVWVPLDDQNAFFEVVIAKPKNREMAEGVDELINLIKQAE